jgi:Domain of unknown function (DUF4307)
MTLHMRPESRYGAPRRWTLPAVVAGVALLIAAGIGWLLWAALYHANPAVSSQLRGFEVTGNNEVRVTIAIQRDPERAVRCLIQAQASDHAVVGEREVTIPSGGEPRPERTYRITTERRATNGILDGCRTIDSVG